MTVFAKIAKNGFFATLAGYTVKAPFGGPNGGQAHPQGGGKTPEKGVFWGLEGGPERGLARLEAYLEPKNDGFTCTAVVGTVGTGHARARVMAGTVHGVRTTGSVPNTRTHRSPCMHMCRVLTGSSEGPQRVLRGSWDSFTLLGQFLPSWDSFFTLLGPVLTGFLLLVF